MRQYWNKTKVICTIGPACARAEILKRMISSGMDVARFNFSHGHFAEHGKLIKLIKSLNASLKCSTALLQDLPGPKVRIGTLKQDFFELKKGQNFLLTPNKIIGTSNAVSVNTLGFIRSLKKNSIVYMNDGLVKLVVTAKKKEDAMCEVLTAGRIYPKKGISCPGQFLNLNAVTDFDLKCLKYGLELGIDFVAVSFVQSAKDILKVKRYLSRKKNNVFVIAKIERKIALENIDEIINVSDAVMVARGDLGIEVKLEEVPFLQKEIIKKANRLNRPVITATQILESMVSSPQPTRAEASDIANAILDGTDALMLSEETAVGKYPVESLKTMVTIAEQTERHLKKMVQNTPSFPRGEGLMGVFSYAAVDIAENANAKAIIVPTQNAGPLFSLSRLRPNPVIVGITSKEDVFKRMILFWGVYPIMVKKFGNLQQTLDKCVQLAKEHRLISGGKNVVIMLTKDNRLFASDIMELRSVG
ncbi:MAG: pyruvate kinase [Candidatus Omnitrophota bacterium]